MHTRMTRPATTATCSLVVVVASTDSHSRIAAAAATTAAAAAAASERSAPKRCRGVLGVRRECLLVVQEELRGRG
jgi:hypothetical protein